MNEWMKRYKLIQLETYVSEGYFRQKINYMARTMLAQCSNGSSKHNELADISQNKYLVFFSISLISSMEYFSNSTLTSMSFIITPDTTHRNNKQTRIMTT